MMNPHWKPTTLALTLLLLLAAPSQAAESTSIRDAGRAIAETHANAVIRVNVIVSMRMAVGGRQAREDEVESEINGTVIGADGLTLVPLSEIDPAGAMMRQFGSRMDGEVNIESHVKDIRLILPDGREIPATVVLRDPVLDVALLRPREAVENPFAAIDLTRSAEPLLLDEVVVLARFGRIANRQIGVMTGEIQSTIRRPRTFHVPSSELATAGMGLPIFDVNQQLVGFVLMRIQPEGMGSDEDSLAIILPAEDIQEMAEQAPQEGEPLAQDAGEESGEEAGQPAESPEP